MNGSSISAKAKTAKERQSYDYLAQRRRLGKHAHCLPVWVKVLDALLIVLVAGDFANLFMAVETTLLANYPVLIAITVSLVGLCVVLPFLAGKVWRQRACGSAEANYLLAVALLLSWVFLLVFISYLRLSVELGQGTGAGTGAGVALGAGTAADAGSIIASLGATANSGNTTGSLALAWLLTAMLSASGVVAFISSWAAADPVRVRLRTLLRERIRLQEAYEELSAQKAEFVNAQSYYEAITAGDAKRYEAAQLKCNEQAKTLKQQVRLCLAGRLQSPAATSALMVLPAEEGALRPEECSRPQECSQQQGFQCLQDLNVREYASILS